MKYSLFSGRLTLCILASTMAAAVQAAMIPLDLRGPAGSGLLPGNENPVVASGGTGGEGSAGIRFDSVTNILSIDIAWGSINGFTDLSSPVTGAHIHGPADQSANAGVLYAFHTLPGFDASASAGGFSGNLAIDPTDVNSLLTGFTYINIHTESNPGGEARGQLVVPNLSEIPLPSTLWLLGSGLLALAGLRRTSHHPRR